MADHPSRTQELESEVQRLTTECNRLKKLNESQGRLLKREVQVVGEEAGFQFERDCFQSAMIVLSKGWFRRLDQELLDFLKQNSPPSIESILDDLVKKAS